MSARFVPVSDLVTVDEIAERLHWSLNTTINVITGRSGRFKLKFPKPLVGKSNRGVWLWTDVEAWHDETCPRSSPSANPRRGSTTYKQPSWSHGRKSA